MALAAAPLPAIGIVFDSSVSGTGSFVITSPTRTPVDNQPTLDATLLLLGRKLVAAAGSFALSGQVATLTKASATPLAVAAPLPSLSLALNPTTGYMYAATRAITVNGQAVTFRRGIGLNAEYGSFTLSGAPADRDLSLTADPVYFVETGRAANLSLARNLVAAYGTFALTGQLAAGAVQDATNRRLPALTGFFVLTGQDVDEANRIMACETGNYSLFGGAAVMEGPTWITVGKSGNGWSDVTETSNVWTDV